MPVGRGHGIDAAPGVGHGVVDQNVQAAMLFGSLLQRTNELGFVAHIGHDGFGTAACRLDPGHDFVERLLAAAADHNGCPLPGETLSRCGTDTGATTVTNAIFPSRRLLMLVSP